MPRHLPSLLSRLRRHRGLWVVVALVLLFKLASSSVCLGDAPTVAQATPGTVVVAVAAAVNPLALPDAGQCLLGESECHCACAHTLPVPAAVPALVALLLPGVTVVPTIDGLRIAPADLPLRPPIA